MTSIVNTHPLVSVLVPAYNHEKFVEEAIRSIWEQTYQNIEIIAINDGSKDDTGKILDDLASVSPLEMQVLHQENQGICKTLNKAIELAKGDYFSMLASDDFFQPDKTAAQVEFLFNNPRYDGVWGDMQVVGSEGEMRYVKPMKPGCREDELFEKHLCLGTSFALQASLFKSAAVKDLRFDENARVEDWDFFLRLFHRYKVAYDPYIVVNYRQVENSLNFRAAVSRSSEKHILELLNKNIENLGLPKQLVKKARFSYWRWEASIYLGSGQRLQAIKSLLRALKYKFPDKKWFSIFISTLKKF